MHTCGALLLACADHVLPGSEDRLLAACFAGEATARSGAGPRDAADASADRGMAGNLWPRLCRRGACTTESDLSKSSRHHHCFRAIEVLQLSLEGYLSAMLSSCEWRDGRAPPGLLQKARRGEPCEAAHADGIELWLLCTVHVAQAFAECNTIDLLLDLPQSQFEPLQDCAGQCV